MSKIKIEKKIVGYAVKQPQAKQPETDAGAQKGDFPREGGEGDLTEKGGGSTSGWSPSLDADQASPSRSSFPLDFLGRQAGSALLRYSSKRGTVKAVSPWAGL